MKIKKMLLGLTIISALVLPGSAVFAEDTQSPSFSSAPTSPFSPMASVGYASQQLIGQQMSYAFNVTSSMPYWRTYIKNTASSSITVTITKGSPTGSVEWSGSVAAGNTTNVWATRVYTADTYYVNFTFGRGNMSGEVAARVASTAAEVLP